MVKLEKEKYCQSENKVFGVFQIPNTTSIWNFHGQIWIFI